MFDDMFLCVLAAIPMTLVDQSPFHWGGFGRLINPLESQIFGWGLYGYLMAIFELNVQHG